VSQKTRLAVVLFNFGGPDTPEAIQPFLFNLFRDPAIIGAPAPIRLALAKFISSSRAPNAKKTYALMGGASPLLKETEAQAEALSAALHDDAIEAKVFIAMRYWRPFTEDAARAVAGFAPDEVVLLPLYPQFSTTTTESSLKAWREAYRGPGRVRAICCYPEDEGLARAHAAKIRETWEKAGRPADIKILFSAHGLPERTVAKGDPYPGQVERTCRAIMAALGEPLPWSLAYQSRVGPLKWIGPATNEVIQQAGAAGQSLLVVPVAFVSEHVETLVELDVDYAHLAKASGCPMYLRAPTVGIAPEFIDGLARLTRDALGREESVTSGCGGRHCPPGSRCPARAV
jgi:protoporphyrin/coproporphyrin ferrochelatase